MAQASKNHDKNSDLGDSDVKWESEMAVENKTYPKNNGYLKKINKERGFKEVP